jgi:hypothetical protein
MIHDHIVTQIKLCLFFFFYLHDKYKLMDCNYSHKGFRYFSKVKEECS